MKISKEAKEFALSHILSSWDDLTYEEVIIALRNVKGKNFDKIDVWMPFEDFTNDQLIKELNGMATSAQELINKVKRK